MSARVGSVNGFALGWRSNGANRVGSTCPVATQARLLTLPWAAPSAPAQVLPSRPESV